MDTVYEVHLESDEREVIYRSSASITSLSPSPDSRYLALIQADSANTQDQRKLDRLGFSVTLYEESTESTGVILLDLESGRAVGHELPGAASGAVKWSYDSALYAVALAPTPQIDDFYMARDVFIVSASDGVVRSKLDIVGKLGEFQWSPDGQRIAWISGANINDPSPGRLFVASLDGEATSVLVPDYAGHVIDFFWSDTGGLVYASKRNTGSEISSLIIENVTEKRLYQDEERTISMVDGFGGSEVIAAVLDSSSHPQEVYLIDGKGSAKRLTDSNPKLGSKQLAVQQVIQYTGLDGLALDAVLIRPRGPLTKRKAPLVVVAHGGPEVHFSNGWESNYDRPGQALASLGYLVAYPNYRGSTGRGVEFSRLSQHAHAEEEFDDLLALKRHLVNIGLADPERTGIIGTSYGGYAAMWAATAFSEHFAAAVSIAGISNHISHFLTTDIPQELYFSHSLAWPWDNWMWMLERSPIYNADRLQTPLLLLHGTDDTRVRLSQSLEMYRSVKLRADEATVRLVAYPGEVHGFGKTAAQYDASLRLVRWLNHYLMGPGGEPPPQRLPHAERLAETEGSSDEVHR